MDHNDLMCKNHTKCRVCESTNLTEYLDLGLMPIANNLECSSESAKNLKKFPLKILFCNECGLSQLSVVVDPKELFSQYTYMSCVNQGYINHCREMAKSLSEKYNLNNNIFHIDIGGNDGTLLLEFQKIINHRILNVDPSENITKIARSKGVPSLTRFWGIPVMYEISERADLITATNVFAHLDNVIEFMVTCRSMLKKDSILVIENPYLINFIDNMEWDTCYHEHMTYWSLLPMVRLCDKYGLKVISVEEQDIHGGSMRYIITRKDSKYIPDKEVKKLYNKEKNKRFDIYSSWANKVNKHILSIKKNLCELKNQNKTIIGFAASAKGVTLLNAANIDDKIIDYIIDETPFKIGKFSPGTGIPIVGIENIMGKLPDYILILSWNFKEEIIDKIKKLGYTGKFIIPVPKFKIIK